MARLHKGYAKEAYLDSPRRGSEVAPQAVPGDHQARQDKRPADPITLPCQAGLWPFSQDRADHPRNVTQGTETGSKVVLTAQEHSRWRRPSQGSQEGDKTPE